MAENEKILDEFELDDIINDSKFHKEQKEMARKAEKYKVKQPMTEIFSNADETPRLTNTNPLDLDKQEEKAEKNENSEDNVIVGEKTAATMEAALLLDGNEKEFVSAKKAETDRQADKSENTNQSENEYKDKQKDENSDSIQQNEDAQGEDEEAEENGYIALTPEYEEGTSFSNEVIGEVEQFKEAQNHIQSINTIDIDLSDDDYMKEELEEKKHEQERMHEIFTTSNESDGKPLKKIVAKVPVYKPDDQVETINVKAGKFSEVVQREYEEYIKSKNPSVMAYVMRDVRKAEDISEEYENSSSGVKEKRFTQEKIVSAFVGLFSNDTSDDTDVPQEKVKPVEDYTGDAEEEKIIRAELNSNIKKLFLRSALTGLIAIMAVLFTIFIRVYSDTICVAVPFAPATYAVMNVLILGLSIYINKVSLLSGLTPLTRFRGNSDTATAVATVAAALQALASFFCLGDLTSFNVNYYTVVVLLSFFANNLGKLFMVLRVRDNFRFAASKGQKYAAKIYNNETVANQMMSGTVADKNIIAYQHKTDFPSNFLKISYAPDPSEELASKLAPVTTIAAVLIAIIYAGAKGSFTGGINFFALFTAISVPLATLLAVNFPVRGFCKTLLSYGSMLAGYPSIKQFCDSTAIMLDATELFPEESIELEGIKTFEEFNVDESLLCGIAILKEAGNPIANSFDSVVAETKETLPEVESVLYEDEMGLVGWINSERILVGSRKLMLKYNVETPAIEYEEKYNEEGRQITYISRAGRLVAMLVTRYTADAELKAELHRAEANGISFLIRTTDYNITNDLVAEKYDLFYRSIRVLPTGLGNVLKEAEGAKEESSRSYLITGGKASSLARAVSGCVKIKHNISLALIIQLIAIILGLLVVATLALYAGVDAIGTLEVMIYTVFWAVASVVAPKLQKP
ncbi:MAG: hypothetical protein MJ089_07520 [Ruminococcus sp.]|nr:hypothetical protein [Ruminococcus sp.]